MNLPEGLLVWLGLPPVGALFGWSASQVWMSKKDRKDFEQKNYENSIELKDRHDAAREEYEQAIAKYTSALGKDANGFYDIATKGDRYFQQLNSLCAAIMSDKVDTSSRDAVLLPLVRSAAAKSLPQHYETLKSISEQYEFEYSGELRRLDHPAIYDVIEKYGSQPTP